MDDQTPSLLKRDGTMQATAKEGNEFLKATGRSDLVVDKSPESEPLNDVSDGTECAEKPKVTRDSTMLETAKEAEQLLETLGKPDDDALTRGQQKKIEEIESETPEPPAKKPKLSKDSTMQATAKEAKELLDGEKLGDTRQETKTKREKRSSQPKRVSTMQKTAKEAEMLLEKEGFTNEDANVRVTRSRRSGVALPSPPPPKRTKKAKQETSKDIVKDTPEKGDNPEESPEIEASPQKDKKATPQKGKKGRGRPKKK